MMAAAPGASGSEVIFNSSGDTGGKSCADADMEHKQLTKKTATTN